MKKYLQEFLTPSTDETEESEEEEETTTSEVVSTPPAMTIHEKTTKVKSFEDIFNKTNNK